MNITPAKLASASAIISRQSTLSASTGPFVDIFQVPTGKIGILVAGSIVSPNNGGITGKVLTIGLCDNSFSYGSGPTLDSSGKVDPQSLGVGIQALSMNTGENLSFNDDFDFGSEPIALAGGWFIRVAVADGAAPPSSGIFIINLIVAIVDNCDC